MAGAGRRAGKSDREAGPERAVFARLIHTYSLDPERVLTLPGWILRDLVAELPAVEARQLERALVAAAGPHMDASDRQRLYRRLEAVLRPAPPPAPVEIIEHDPAKAAEWFAARGADVVH